MIIFKHLEGETGESIKPLSSAGMLLFQQPPYLFSRALPRFFISLLTLVLTLFQQIIVYLCCLLLLSHLNTNYLRVEVLLFCSQLYPRCLEHCLAHKKNSNNICDIYRRHCPHPLISSAPTPSKHIVWPPQKGIPLPLGPILLCSKWQGRRAEK